MANYNFTMKQFNGTGYDTLYPQNTSQQSLLNDNTLAIQLGLSGTPTVDDALNKLKDYHVEVTSYVGTGQSGASNPCSVTFTFAPKAVFFIGCNSSASTMYRCNAWTSFDMRDKFVIGANSLTTSYLSSPGGNGFGFDVEGANGNYSFGKKSSDGRTISWYCVGGGYPETDQLNDSGVTYYFLGVW